MALENSIWWFSIPTDRRHQYQVHDRSARAICTIDGVEVFLRLIVQLLGFFLELLKAALCIDINRILCVVANVEALLELLRCSSDALAYTLETHLEGRSVELHSAA